VWLAEPSLAPRGQKRHFHGITVPSTTFLLAPFTVIIIVKVVILRQETASTIGRTQDKLTLDRGLIGRSRILGFLQLADRDVIVVQC